MTTVPHLAEMNAVATSFGVRIVDPAKFAWLVDGYLGSTTGETVAEACRSLLDAFLDGESELDDLGVLAQVGEDHAPELAAIDNDVDV